MKFSKDFPTENGWYWAWFKDEHMQFSQIEILRLDSGCVWVHGRDEFFEVQDVLGWGDRVEFPE